jgi:hypothetical protein
MSSNELSETQSQTPSASAPSATSTAGSRGVQLKAMLRATDGYDAQAAMLEPVQRHGGKEDAGHVHKAAAHGLSGSGGSLPHGGAIQKAFGGYDISNVVAHTDAAAAQGATAMGADAYATGNSIAFKGAPDLHTAAHEAAHVVQQQAGVSLSGGVGKAGDAYEQHADKVADAVVAGKSAEPILAEMAGGGSGSGVQKRAVQREETTPTTTPSATPHGDAALAQVRGDTAGTDNTASTETETSAPVITVPQAFDPYCGHIRDTFAADIAQLRQMQEDFKAKTKDVKAEMPRVEGNLAKQQKFEKELAEKKEGLTKEEKRKQDFLAMMAPFDGKTMEDLYKMALQIVADQAKAQEEGKANRLAMEGVMNAAMQLLGKVDPDSGEFGRTLYSEKIDKQENGRLVAKAQEEGMPPAENAALAVNYRTWARVFMREELMLDKTCTEILYMRDLVKSGREAGESPETIIEKVFISKRAELGLSPEDTFDQATEEQKLIIYEGMIESAKKTNESVNDTMKKGDDKSSGAPKTGP